ncbi:putative heparan-alpha-glucosaminide N-acetyltransferase [Helianthus annuus]|nr:putative heparan-alpha-glucosaminide N-acetyltransferase [Helianthus annuus]KAJ0654862.1 putative heparan-alpha-glucosaminide N-acetyltransferase [Helianthus annuus]
MEGPKRLEEGFGHAQISMAGEKPKTTMVELTDDQIKTTTKENEQPNGGDNPLLTKKSKRVATLDAFRGLTIVLMILVDDAGGVYERMDHSPWNGCTLADFVLPFFLFIVGVAIALALKVQNLIQNPILVICTHPESTLSLANPLLYTGGLSNECGRNINFIYYNFLGFGG